MGLIGREIIQSRVWIDPNTSPPPNLNYKFTFPITVFDAVRRDIGDDDSETLATVLSRIENELLARQPIIPAKSADHLVTYGGAPGAVGAIKITQKIPFDEESQSNNRIPTEKAVGDLLRKFGLVNSEGEETGESVKFLWTNILGRPEIHDSLGNDTEGIMSQAAITSLINDLREEMQHVWDDIDSTALAIEIRAHINDTNNPHGVTIEQIGAASKVAFESHVNDVYNPHGVTATQIGLGNVDNTADIDKPISRSTQIALDAINTMIGSMTGMVGQLRYVIDVNYDQPTGRLNVSYNDNTEVGVTIVTDGLIDEIIIDENTHELVITELGGTVKRLNASSLIAGYIGIPGTHIVVEVSENNGIKASIIPKSITSNEIADNSIATSVFADKAVTGQKIADLTITTINLANDSVTSEKIKDGVIKDDHIEVHSLTGHALFTSDVDNRILAVKEAGTDAQWIQLVNEMIADHAVDSRALAIGAVTSENIAEKAVSTDVLDDKAVTTEKLSNGAVTGEKIAPDSQFPGTPSIETSPDADADNSQIPDTSWVRKLVDTNVFTADNIANRSINGSHLFSSLIKNRILVVKEVNGDPEWGTIGLGMIDDEAVDSINIKDYAVTESKLGTEAVTARAMGRNSVESAAIVEGAVTGEKIFESDTPNRALVVGPDGGHPTYSQITTEMISPNAVTEDKLADQSVTLAKFAHPGTDNSVLVFDLENHGPEWSKIGTKFIEDYSVTGEKLFTSTVSNMVLAVGDSNTPPRYMKVTADMLADDIKFSAVSMGEESILRKHLTKKIINSDYVDDNAIKSRHISEGTVTARELFKSTERSRVLAVGKDDDEASWIQIQTAMIEDAAITSEKIFKSERAYRVLAAVNIGDSPDYTQLTEEFFEDRSIGSSKLKANLMLAGSPSIGVHPHEFSDDFTIADTSWVRKTVKSMMELYFGSSNLEVPDHSINGAKLFTSNIANRVLGVDTANGDTKFMTVNTDMLDNASVTKDKLVRSIELLGSPTVEVRPEPQASDRDGGGDLIPDCQWVLDRIRDQIDLYHAKLQREVPCLNPDGDVNTGDGGTEAVSVMIDDIPDNTVEGILDGSIEPTPARSIFYNNTEISPISDEVLEGIVNGTFIPTDSEDESLDLGAVTIESIPDEVVESIISGEYIPDDPDSPPVIITGGGNGSGTGGCCCSSNQARLNKRYISPIDEETLGGILSGNIVPETEELLEVDGVVEVERISDERLLDMMDGSATPPAVESNPVIVRSRRLAPISVDRIRQIITGEATPEPSLSMDVSKDGEPVTIPAVLEKDTVITEYIQDHAVTGEKIFTSEQPNRVLAVVEANSDPQWTLITRAMMEDHIITPDLMFSSNVDNRILAVRTAGEDPEWMQINNAMMEDCSVDNRVLAPSSITGDKLMDFSITPEKLVWEPMIMEIQLFDNAVSTRKIQNDAIVEEKIASEAVTNEKIKDNTIQGEKLAEEIRLPKNASASASEDLERRSIRNTVISNKLPSGGKNGDIWFQYS